MNSYLRFGLSIAGHCVSVGYIIYGGSIVNLNLQQLLFISYPVEKQWVGGWVGGVIGSYHSGCTTVASPAATTIPKVYRCDPMVYSDRTNVRSHAGSSAVFS